MGEVVALEASKRCRGVCQAVRPLSDFPTYRNEKRGCVNVRTVCKDCNRKRDRTYKAKKRLNDPAFYQRELERAKEYRDRYPDGYRNHMIRKRTKNKSLYHSDIFYRLSRIIGAAKSRASKKGMIFDISAEFAHVLIHAQQFRCAVTGVEFRLIADVDYHKNPFAPSLDRKDSNKGYTIENVQLVCTWYNMFKNEWSDKDVRSLVFTAYHTMFGENHG